MDKTLTISIAAYNAENDLARCLDSMVAIESADDLEIIVVNDGSKDNTLRIAQSYQKKHPQIIKIIDKKNGGHGSTINASIKIAQGKYFKIVDADDWVDKNGLEKLITYLKSHDADLVFNPYYEIDAESLKRKNLVYPSNKNENFGKIFSIEAIKDTIIYMHSITFKTSVIKKMGSVITENCFYVDMEYTIFPMLYVHDFVYLDFPVYEYLLGTLTQSMNMQNMIKRRDQHLKVTKRITEFYCNNQNAMSENLRKIILRRIRYAVLNQYSIYLNMNSKEGKREVVQFDKWLKEKNTDIYQGAEGKTMQWIRLSRKMDFFGFSIGQLIFSKKNEDLKKKVSSLD